MGDEVRRTPSSRGNVTRQATSASPRHGTSRRTSRAAARRKKKQQRLFLIVLAAVVVIVLIVYLIATGGSEDKSRTSEVLSENIADLEPTAEAPVVESLVFLDASDSQAAQSTEDAVTQPAADSTLSSDTAEIEIETATEDVAVEAQSTQSSAALSSACDAVSSDPERAARASTRPEQKEGFLPVFSQANTEEKIIAITVDDCFQVNNLKQIIQLALDYDGKLTLFPIGEQAMRETHAPVIKAAWEAGMEIENHTYTHNGLYKCDDEELAKEIYIQNYALSYILGGEYKCHFLRPRGGDARWDQRIHAYCSQMGYYGIAHWSVSGRSSDVINQLEPGAIFLFHTTDTDLEVLRELIPAAAAQGYRMVTLNEMFGYDDNEFTPCEISREMPEVPALEPYEEVYVQLKKGTYSHSVMRLQERLVELGYLDDEPDACYGENTQYAVASFQRNAGLEVDGIAGPATQTAIYSDSAPSA